MTLIGGQLVDLRSTCRVVVEPGIQPKVRAELLRQSEDGTRPDNPLGLARGDAVELTSIDFTTPLAALHRTA